MNEAPDRDRAFMGTKAPRHEINANESFGMPLHLMARSSVSLLDALCARCAMKRISRQSAKARK